MGISLCLLSNVIVELISPWEIIDDVDLDANFLVMGLSAESIGNGILRSLDPSESGADGLDIAEPSVLSSVHSVLVEEPAESFLVCGDGDLLAMHIGAKYAETMD